MKHKKKNGRMKRRGSRKTLVWGLLWFFIIILICHAIYSFSHSSNVNAPQVSPFKAAIVDHLSLSQPNQTFIQTATNILETAGFTVDYYKGEEVTVGFYRNLPTHGYRIIILRVHSSATEAQGTEGPVTLFTSERVSQTKYVYEQLTGQLVGVAFSSEEREEGIGYFGITPLFVSQAMKGKFQNTIIIMMGCEGLDNPLMAEAFVQRGAKVYISWNQGVLASHTDLATIRLLQHFIIETRTLKEAVRKTFKEVGPDPSYKSLLLYYPLEAGNYTIQNIIGNLAPNLKEIKTQLVLEKMKGCKI